MKKLAIVVIAVAIFTLAMQHAKADIRFEKTNISKGSQQQAKEIPRQTTPDEPHDAKAVEVAQTPVQPTNDAQIAPKSPEFTIGGGCEQYRGLVSQYDWNVNIAMAIMQAESSCISNNVGGPNWNGTYDFGLFQLNSMNITDPAENVRVAYQNKYLTQGWGAWSVYNSGKYTQFLK